MPIARTLSARVAAIAEGLSVARSLPNARQRSVGPFVFFDHFGPIDLSKSTSADVGPHPHTGLATVTYLLEGEMVHRDSLGSVQTIQPGDINWMSAGRGIVHSERVPEETHRETHRLHGLQLWVALPEEQEQSEPSFQHVGTSEMPLVRVDAAAVKILVGSALAVTSPVAAASRTLYLDVTLPAAGKFELPPLEEELALYPLGAGLLIDGKLVEPHVMAVVEAGSRALVSSDANTRFVVIGGERLAKPVHMWWNFVSTEPERIAEAAARWEERRFPEIPGEKDLVKMPPFRRTRQ